MSLLEDIHEHAKRHPKRIVLPEPEDERTLRAAARIEDSGIARVILVGNPKRIREKAAELGIHHAFHVVNPARAKRRHEFAHDFYELRKSKGVTEEEAEKAILDPILYGIMMIHEGLADGLVAGAIHSTGDTLRPALQVLRTAPGARFVSSFFLVTTALGQSFFFADCALVVNPNAEELSQIALDTAHSALAFGVSEPRVAMLSFSTMGSGHGPMVDKVREATALAQAKLAADSPIRIDGDLQLDAAIIPEIAARKAPDSQVAGRANVLIFPDLNAGNIGYKLVERFAGARAVGPILQGLRFPVNDLSRGCSEDDIVDDAAMTVVQAQMHDDDERQTP